MDLGTGGRDDGQEVSLMDERGGRDGEGEALSHFVTNDGGRSKPFHS